MINALITRILKDGVLRQAHHSVARASKEGNEEEASYSDPVSKASRMFRGAFKRAEVVNHFVQGLKPSVLEAITLACRQMSYSDKLSIAVVREVSVSQGRSQRYLMSETMD